MRKRKYPSPSAKTGIIESQNGKCLYCGVAFDVITLAHFDHFKPYSACDKSLLENFVAACPDCNQLKADKIFDTKEAAREYIRKKRMLRGLPIFDVSGIKALNLYRKCRCCHKGFKTTNSRKLCCSPRCAAYWPLTKKRYEMTLIGK